MKPTPVTTPPPLPLDALAEATTPESLRAAHRDVKRAVTASRRTAHRAEGRLAQVFADAMAVVDQQRAAGVSREERLKGLEGILREAWPKTRDWHYLCEACDDTGLVQKVCRKGARCDGGSTRMDSQGGTPGKYRRLCVLHPESDYEHDYGEPCHCPKGARFQSTPKSQGDYTQAGRSGKGMSKVGR